MARQTSHEELERIRKATANLRPVIELYRERLPIALYYAPPGSGIPLLYLYKYLLDHLTSLENNSFKYSFEDLEIVEERLRRQLNFMRRFSSNLNDTSGLEIDWTEV